LMWLPFLVTAAVLALAQERTTSLPSFVLTLIHGPGAICGAVCMEMLRPGVTKGQVHVAWHCLAMLAWAAVFVRLTGWSVRRIWMFDSAPANAHSRKAVRSREGWPWLEGKLARWPLLWRETLWLYESRLSRVVSFVLVPGLLAIAATILALTEVLARPKTRAPAFLILACVPLLIGLAQCWVFASTRLTWEKQRRTYDDLLTSPLTAGQIVRQKFVASLMKSHFFLIPAMLIPWMGAALGIINTTQAAGLTVIFAAGIFMTLASGIAWSSLCRTSTGALIGSLVMLVVFMGVIAAASFYGLEWIGRLHYSYSHFDVATGNVFADASFFILLTGPEAGRYVYGDPSIPLAGVYLSVLLHVSCGMLLFRWAVRRVARQRT
jgi:hypothetical protein